MIRKRGAKKSDKEKEEKRRGLGKIEAKEVLWQKKGIRTGETRE